MLFADVGSRDELLISFLGEGGGGGGLRRDLYFCTKLIKCVLGILYS